MEYPKWMYHRTLPAVIVQDPDEEAALGPGWASHPSLLKDEPEEDDTPAYRHSDYKKGKHK